MIRQRCIKKHRRGPLCWCGRIFCERLVLIVVIAAPLAAAAAVAVVVVVDFGVAAAVVTVVIVVAEVVVVTGFQSLIELRSLSHSISECRSALVCFHLLLSLIRMARKKGGEEGRYARMESVGFNRGKRVLAS